MTWTINNPPDIIKNKSKEIIQACVLAANSALAKGLTQEEAIFAAMGTAKRLEQSSVTKQVKPRVPQHIQALLNKTVEQLKEPEHKAAINRAFLGKSALPSNQDRTLVSADFNDKNQLVLLFDTGEQLITKAIDIDQSIQQYLSVTTGGTSGPITGLTNPTDFLGFNLSAAHVAGVGELSWNDVDGTLDLGMKGGNVTLQLGQEQHVRILNKTGSTFLSPQVVRLSGAQGNRLTADLSIASNATFADNTFAVVTESILNNQQGFATTSGLVRDVDTSAFPEGADLYLSSVTAGAITNIPPVAPARVIRIGYCVRSHHINGSIFVAILEHPDIVELGSVLITSPQENQVLMYEQSTGLWKNKSVSEGEDVLAKRVDFVGEDIIYKAEAPVGTTDGSSLWRIRKITIAVDGDVSETWASGNSTFNKIWTDRLTYTYS